MRSHKNGPRERFLQGGETGLSDAELLALCLRTGRPGQPAVALADELLAHFSSLTGVLAASNDRLLHWPGLGAAKVATIKAALVMTERMLHGELTSAPVFTTERQVARYLRLRLGLRAREAFACLMLDTRHRLLRFEVLFEGTIDMANVHPRELIKRCLEVNAAAIILAHNHPSGVPEPSVADITLTERLQPLLRELGVRLLDHVVVGRGQVVSMAARGLIQRA